MATVRAGALLACAAAVALCGCGGSTFSPETPAGVSLAGSWKLNHGASDDPQKVLAKMRDQATKIIRHQQAEIAARTGTLPPDVMGDAPATEGSPPPAAAPGQGGPRRGDPLRRSPMASVIRTMLERGDFLTVRQSPDEFVLDYGTSRRSFTPGLHSVVSAEGGVGDQSAGWHHKSFVIKVKPQNGPEVTETYALSADGKQLIETFAIASAELPAETLKRVYDPTSETAPRVLPTTD
jgi:hypothetical protein